MDPEVQVAQEPIPVAVAPAKDISGWNRAWKQTLYGTDPELFITNDGELVPAFTFLPDKKNPIPVEDRVSGHTAKANIFWDGFQAEFNTPPCFCLAYLVDGIRLGYKSVLDQAQIKYPNAKVTFKNVFEIPKATMRLAEAEHTALGCEPSENAYAMCGKAVLDGRKLKYRFAGGHIHVAHPNVDLNNKPRYGLTGNTWTRDDIEARVKTLDMIIGVYSVGAAASIDNPIRRRFYGLAGEYRIPKYGFEYRTLSNWWHVHPGISNLVLMMTRMAMHLHEENFADAWLAHPQETIEAINNCDVKLAREILFRNREVIAAMVTGMMDWRGEGGDEDFYNDDVDSDINTKVPIELAMQIGMHGVESVISDPEDFVKNWKISSGKWTGHADGKGEGWRHLVQRKAKLI